MNVPEVQTTIEACTDSATSVLRTLVICDLVDSTAIVERLGDQRAAQLFRLHDKRTRALLRQHDGQEIDKTDGFLFMFERPIRAVAFALDYQRELVAIRKEEGVNLQARVGIHVGDIVIWDNAADDINRGAKKTEVEGLVKPVAARLMQLALPGQILLSGVAYDIAHRAQGELGLRLVDTRWRTHGRYRFKGVPDLVPVFEVGEQGIAPLKPPVWSSKAHREIPIWRRPMVIGLELVALLILIAVPTWYLTRPMPAIAFANRDWVVMGDLKNLTGEKAFDDSLQTAFRIGLEQSRYVNVIPDLQTRDALKRMNRKKGTAVDRDVGSEIALREGAHALILPTVAEIGGRVRITAEVIDPHTQTSVYSESVDGVGEQSVLPSIDELLKKMRGRFGESMASIGQTSAPLAEVTTENLDALKAYSLGLKAMLDGDGNNAVSLFSRATELDPAFAQAYLALANVYYSIGKKTQAREYVDKATLDLDRLSARERLTAEGYKSLFQTPREMHEKWSLYATLYPDAMSGQNNLGLVEWWFDNDLIGAASNFEQVAASRHPRRGYSWMFLGNVQLALGQTDAARTSYRTAREVGAPQLQFDPVNLALATRDYPAASSAIDHEPTHEFPFFEAEKELRRAELGVDRGQFRTAATAATAALKIAGQANLESAQQRARMSLVIAQLADADPSAGTALEELVAEQLKRLAASPGPYEQSSYVQLTLAAMQAMRNGKHALAARALAALGPRVEHSGYFSLEQPYRVAMCELDIESDAAAAIACLERERGDRAYYQTWVALMRAYRAAGRDADATATARWLADHRGKAMGEYLGEYAAHVPNLMTSNEALLDLAESALAAGNIKEATLRLNQFLEAWRGADSDSVLWRRAQALSKRLGGEKEKG